MKPETLRALKGSIKHWEENCAALSIDDISMSSESCALCERFRRFDDKESMYYCQTRDGEKCPVYERTGMSGCRNSPYDEAEELYTFYEREAVGVPDDLRVAMWDELAFLISLLPQEEANEP